MSIQELELNVLIEKIRSNDTTVGTAVKWHRSLRRHACLESDGSFVQFIEALKMNTTLTEIDLGGNALFDDGAKYLADVLKVNTTLKSITIHRNAIGDVGISYIAEALRVNTTLNKIRFCYNHIGVDGAKHIAEALKVNTTLTLFDLTDNAIGDAGAKHLADMLKGNATLTCLTLCGNEIGDDGVRDISEVLKVNSTLVEIDLRGTVISKVAASHIIDALKVNATLTYIWLSWGRYGKCVNKDDFVTIESLCQRNWQFRKAAIHERIVDTVIALSSLHLPPYVILEIVDKFEYWSLLNRKFKIDTIIAVDKSCKHVRSLRK